MSNFLTIVNLVIGVLILFNLKDNLKNSVKFIFTNKKWEIIKIILSNLLVQRMGVISIYSLIFSFLFNAGNFFKDSFANELILAFKINTLIFVILLFVLSLHAEISAYQSKLKIKK